MKLHPLSLSHKCRQTGHRFQFSLLIISRSCGSILCSSASSQVPRWAGCVHAVQKLCLHCGQFTSANPYGNGMDKWTSQKTCQYGIEDHRSVCHIFGDLCDLQSTSVVWGAPCSYDGQQNCCANALTVLEVTQ